jgi:hypothetical protein
MSITDLDPAHNHDAFCSVLGCYRGIERPRVEASLEDQCASVEVTVRYDKERRRYIATVVRSEHGSEQLSKEGVTPGEAATRVWGAAIDQLRRGFPER